MLSEDDKIVSSIKKIENGHCLPDNNSVGHFWTTKGYVFKGGKTFAFNLSRFSDVSTAMFSEARQTWKHLRKH